LFDRTGAAFYSKPFKLFCLTEQVPLSIQNLLNCSFGLVRHIWKNVQSHAIRCLI